MWQEVEAEINRIANRFYEDQLPDGSWGYPFETGISSDCYLIILLRMLEINDEELIRSLVNRIVKKQESNGAWKLFYDEGDGNVSTTVEAYYALLFSGYRKRHEPEMLRAKQFILSKGGIQEAHTFTKIMLAITGQYEWPAYFSIPVEVMLLPLSFPVNFYDLSVFGRANFAPILILADYKYSIKSEQSPDLSDLFIGQNRAFFGDFGLNDDQNLEWHSVLNLIKHGIQSIVDPDQSHEAALKRTEEYMLKRIEPDGTFECFFSATFLMIFALLARGYAKTDPIIRRAVQGLKSMICQIGGNLHAQYTTANVWNTTLISYALQEAGLSPSTKVIQKANQYILSRQQNKYGDWAVHNPHAKPGGWGFSDMNTINPDVDDSTAALRAIRRLAPENAIYRRAWERGMDWVLSMQNSDGGWPAFERNVDKEFLTLLPIEEGQDILIDPSTPDLTGRTLGFLGDCTYLNRHYPMIKRGIKWLLDSQREDGSWFGRWGICYLYGTWAAVTGMRAVGVPHDHPSIQKAVTWLKKTQNPDGGWGESCRSDIEKRYIPLGVSTRTHTAWALDALIAASGDTTPEIERGIHFLAGGEGQEKWIRQYPKGKGMAGAFYIHYHSYDYIWPLLALVHYKKKFF
ncbi:squalene--hopene cyclase [Fictibacillus gelatini]|uniref:squalene--hopene cyclase n=1 Tax=Fictibacillus gelatini TaxID=225985 RepID=UPI00041C58C9|nr:squalene--hopene cyclase [Fictibacillus gelatini]